MKPIAHDAGARAGMLILIAIAILAISSCQTPVEPADEFPGVVRVMAGIHPIGFLAREIGGADLKLTVLLPPGANPHSYEVRPSQMEEIANTRLFLSAGLPFERAIIGRLPERDNLTVIEVGEGIARRTIEHAAHDADDASDGHDHGPESLEEDPHIWFTPANLKTMAEEVRDGLILVDPGNARDYTARHEALAARLDALDARLASILAPFKGRRFYAYHAAFGYLAAAYGLEQVPVETGGKEPSPRRIAALIDQARRDGVRIILVQPQFSTRSAEAIAHAIGGAVAPVDPEGADPLAELERLATILAGALHAPGEERR